MIYCLSDLHGRYDLYVKMLEKLHLTEDDTLYILGDAVDRGRDGIKILLDIMERKNVTFLQGNHDRHAAILLNILGKPIPKGFTEDDITRAFYDWFSEGGNDTFTDFKKLDGEARKKLIKFIGDSLCKINLTVNGKNYLLAHTVPEFDKWNNSKKIITDIDYIEGEPDYDICYDKELTIVTGHTPTNIIDVNSKCRIWRGNNHIAIDCGAYFYGTLGCICLDNEKEFYVE